MDSFTSSNIEIAFCISEESPKAIVAGLNPLLATMSVIGLISLPGMMTGQILGGASPVIAIKYQVMIMLAIFTGCTLALILSILFTKSFLFDDFDAIK